MKTLLTALILSFSSAVSFAQAPLRVMGMHEPANLDWTKTTSTFKVLISQNIMEGLVKINSQLAATPALATSWTSSADGKVFTFEIRKGVKWTDGVELKAQHFADSFSRNLGPKADTMDRHFFTGVIKAKANGPYTFEVTLDKPIPHFVMKVAYTAFFPVRADLIAKHGTEWAAPKNLVTLGPYRIDAWNRGKEIILAANPSYYGEKPHVKRVAIDFDTDGQRVVQRFIEGEIDVIPNISALDILRVKLANVQHSVLKAPFFHTEFVAFNLLSPRVSDVNVRRAIAYAIDKKALVAKLERSFYVAESFIPLGLPGFSTKPLFSFDAAKAKQQLSLSPLKTEVAKGLTMMTLPGQTSEIMETVADMIRRNLGVPVTVEMISAQELSKSKDYGRFDIRWGSWYADYPHASNFLELYLSTAATNRINMKNQGYDRMVASGIAAATETEAAESFRVAQNILLHDEVGIIPLFHSSESILLSKRVKKIEVSPMHEIYFHKIVAH